MSYIFSSDSSNTNNFTIDATTTTPELPPSLNYNSGSAYDPNATPYDPTIGTTAQPALATVERSAPGITLGGVLSGVTATAQSALNLWGQVNALQDNVANAQLQRTIQQQKTALTSAQTLGALDLAQKQSAATMAIETARLNASVKNDLAKVSTGSPGTLSHIAGSNMWLIAAVAIGGFFLYKKMGK